MAAPRSEPELRGGRSSVTALHVHLVFVTKYRRPVFNDPLLTDCQQLMAAICTDLGVALREFNGEADHVHLLVHYPWNIAISTMVNRLKGPRHAGYASNPARVREYLWGNHFWSPSYFAASCWQRTTSIISNASNIKTDPTNLGRLRRPDTTGSASSRP